MEENKINTDNTFEYTYSAKRQKEVEAIRKKYEPKQADKLEQLRRLDQSAETPGTVMALVLGIVGMLLFGMGMSCTMVWQETYFVLGIVVGVLGMVFMGVAYPIYKKITKVRREQIAPQILTLSEEILGGDKK